MKIKKTIICIGGTHFVDAKLELTMSRAEALAISGSRNAKKLANWLKSKGVKKITLIEV